MMKLTITTLALSTLLFSGCAVHHHHGKSLDNEHGRKNVIVIHKAPHKKRKCWQHKKHWHCKK